MMQRIRDLCRYLSVASLFAIIAITLVQITLRALFDIPLTGVEELSRFLFIAFIFFGLPHYYRKDGHIGLSGIRNFLTPRNARMMGITLQLVCVIVFAVIVFSGIRTLATNYDSATPTLAIPFWIFFAPIVLGFGLLLAEHLLDLAKAIKEKA